MPVDDVCVVSVTGRRKCACNQLNQSFPLMSGLCVCVIWLTLMLSFFIFLGAVNFRGDV